MNVFRSKKKQALKDIGEDSIGRPSQDSDAPPPLKAKKTFRMNKKKEVEPPKFELDLVNALPASDDFRTSLLMTGLSARFSMLREQDDPSSKLGKASDDSVLFPRRQSRMNNFDFSPSGLGDIAEVGSIKDSRRPFGSIGDDRIGSSYSQDGYGTDIEGSIMNRAKPAEGNVLFGGRQKVYKIANHAVSANKVDSASSGLGGRALYDDDLGLSAFQRLKLREKEEKERIDAEINVNAPEATASRPESPTLAGYNRNRETSSTTSSGPSGARSSTAATSFMSGRTPSVNGQSNPSTPAVPLQASSTGSFIKNRRVHDNTGDNTSPQLASATGRFEGRNGTVRSPSPDAPTRFQTAQRQLSAASQRPATRSPPAAISANAGFDFGVPAVTPESRRTPGTVPPLSPPHSEGDDTMLPLQSNSTPSMDTPASIKPKGVYDDAKYQERQLQMQQGRDMPPVRKNSPPRPFSPVKAAEPDAFSRSRADSQAASGQGYENARSRSQSSTQREFVPRERMAYPSRTDVVSPDAPPPAPRFFAPRNDTVPTPALTPISEPKPLVSAWEQASAYDEFQEDMPPEFRSKNMPAPQHPALRRDRLSDRDEPKRNSPFQGPSPQTSRLPSPIDLSKQQNVRQPADSPTLPPPGGLSGLVRQHLRSDSDASSVNGEDINDINDFSPTASSMFSERTERSVPKGPPGPTRGRDAPPSGQTRFLANQPDSRAISRASDTPSWEKELYRHHSREMSTDTQQERDDFASELAARRRKVQENLRNFAESESRSQSPVRAPMAGAGPNEASFAKNNRLNFLKSKTSRGSLVTNDQPPPSQLKPMALAMGNGSSPNVNSRFDDSQLKREEEEMMRGVSKAVKTPPAADYMRARKDAQRERERQMMDRRGPLPNGHDMRSSEERSRRQLEQPMPFRQQDYGRDRQPSSRARDPSRDAPPVSFRGTPQPRNGSQPSSANNSRPGTGERSSSEGRNDGYRSDRGRPSHEQEYGSYGQQQQMRRSPNLPPSGGMPPQGYQNGPAPRSRAESRTQQFPGYFEGNSALPSHATSPYFDSQRQAPLAPYAANPTPPLAHQPPPAGSGRGTPVTPLGFQTQHFENQRQAPGARKKSVNKHEISEPQFVSTTSRISTIQLPSNESGSGGGVYAPPLPPMDPRRRTPSNAKSMFGAFSRKDEYANHSSPDLPQHMQNQTEERMGMGSANGGDYQGGQQQRKEPRKLRKMSSEGANLNARNQQVFRQTPSPAVPAFTGDGQNNMF